MLRLTYCIRCPRGAQPFASCSAVHAEGRTAGRHGSYAGPTLFDIAHPTAEGKPYLGVVEDACSNRTVGYSIDSPMASPLAVKALRNALAPRAAVDTIVHSERGSSPGHPAVWPGVRT